jgi:hypothetical protein
VIVRTRSTLFTKGGQQKVGSRESQADVPKQREVSRDIQAEGDKQDWQAEDWYAERVHAEGMHAEGWYAEGGQHGAKSGKQREGR